MRDKLSRKQSNNERWGRTFGESSMEKHAEFQYRYFFILSQEITG